MSSISRSLFVALLFSARLTWAQTEDPGETILLSPFQVSTEEDRGYHSSSSAAGRRYSPPPEETAPMPTVPITLIKRADAVVIQFALSNSTDKQDARNKQLSGSIDAISSAIKTVPGLKLEHREVRLTSGDRKGSFIGKGDVVTSFANIAIIAEITAEMRLYERVKQVRVLVDGAKLVAETKVIDGPVGLFVRRPNEARKELLAKIFEDLELVKKGLGSDFEVLVSGLSQGVHLRSCSESDVELWIDYAFSIRSVRELEATKAKTKI
jgi:hypothetical protein